MTFDLCPRCGREVRRQWLIDDIACVREVEKLRARILGVVRKLERPRLTKKRLARARVP